MTTIKILNEKAIKLFDSLPEFNNEEKKIYFYFYNWTKEVINKLKQPTGKVGFVLQLGYFKASNKFFPADTFSKKDIKFVARKLNINISNIKMEEYHNNRNFYNHQNIIIKKLAFKQFNKETLNLLSKKTKLFLVPVNKI